MTSSAPAGAALRTRRTGRTRPPSGRTPATSPRPQVTGAVELSGWANDFLCHQRVVRLPGPADRVAGLVPYGAAACAAGGQVIYWLPDSVLSVPADSRDTVRTRAGVHDRSRNPVTGEESTCCAGTRAGCAPAPPVPRGRPAESRNDVLRLREGTGACVPPYGLLHALLLRPVTAHGRSPVHRRVRPRRPDPRPRADWRGSPDIERVVSWCGGCLVGWGVGGWVRTGDGAGFGGLVWGCVSFCAWFGGCCTGRLGLMARAFFAAQRRFAWSGCGGRGLGWVSGWGVVVVRCGGRG